MGAIYWNNQWQAGGSDWMYGDKSCLIARVAARTFQGPSPRRLWADGAHAGVFAPECGLCAV